MSDHPKPRRTQAERTRARKEQIIRAAILYFGQHGYHAAKLSDIAKAAGVTEPGLLHHYPSKVQLLMDVLAERDRVDQQRFDPSDFAEAGGLLPSTQALVEYNQTVPGLVQLFTVLSAESIDAHHPGHDYFLKRYDILRKYYAPLIADLQERGELRRDLSAEDLAVLLITLMDGLQIQWLYAPGEVDMVQEFGRFVKILKEDDRR
jgi:AcrR family transcriptional regulator